MNEPLLPADPGTKTGIAPVAPVAGSVPQKPIGATAPGISAPPALPPVPIGSPGYKFAFPLASPQGQDERREHERIRKADLRAAARPVEPLPLPPTPLVGPTPAAAGQLGPGAAAAPGAVVPEPFVPWLAADIADFTDELVELTEAKRIADFVALTRDAGLPSKLVAEIERKSGYPTQSKAALKRTLAECAAKWLNKSGVSSQSKEEVKLLFCVVTIKIQGVRLKRDLLAMIEEDRDRQYKEAQKIQKAKEQAAV